MLKCQNIREWIEKCHNQNSSNPTEHPWNFTWSLSELRKRRWWQRPSGIRRRRVTESLLSISGSGGNGASCTAKFLPVSCYT